MCCRSHGHESSDEGLGTSRRCFESWDDWYISTPKSNYRSFLFFFCYFLFLTEGHSSKGFKGGGVPR